MIKREENEIQKKALAAAIIYCYGAKKIESDKLGKMLKVGIHLVKLAKHTISRNDFADWDVLMAKCADVERQYYEYLENHATEKKDRERFRELCKKYGCMAVSATTGEVLVPMEQGTKAQVEFKEDLFDED